MRYFVQTVRFSPSFEKLGYQHLENNQYVYTDGSLWETKKLLDLGWGPENGLIRVPLPNYEKLLFLVFQPVKESRTISDEQYNMWGALCILLEKYPMDFLNHIENNINNSDFAKRFLPIYELSDRILCWDVTKIHLLSQDEQKIAQKWFQIKKHLQIIK